MKRVFRFLFKTLVLAGGVAACAVFYLYIIGWFDPVPAVGLLAAPSGEDHLDLPALEAALEAEELPLLKAEDGEDYVQAAARMIEAGARALIVPLDEPRVSQALLDAADSAGVALIFVGEYPGRAALSSGDNFWYLGGLPAHGGELVGKELALDYREGVVADSNGDLLLQYYLYQSAPDEEQTLFSDNLLAECEHYGVYNTPVSWLDEEGSPLPFEAQALEGQAAPEAILCSCEADALYALEVADALGWREGDTPVRVYAMANTPEAAARLLESGVEAAAYFEPAAVSAAAAIMAANALEYQFIATGTDLSPDAQGRVLLPCDLAQ